MPGTSGMGNEAMKSWVRAYVEDALSSQASGGGISAYPVGSIYMSVNATSPAEIFGGEWEALDEGRVLIGANASHPAGQKGGSETHKLTTGEMPSHSHSGSLGGSLGDDGSHRHDRGNMNITGKGPLGWSSNKTLGMEGAFYKTSANVEKGFPENADNESYTEGFDASKSWSGYTGYAGTHSHSLSTVTVHIDSNGSGQAHNNMQPYLSVYMWKRTA